MYVCTYVSTRSLGVTETRGPFEPELGVRFPEGASDRVTVARGFESRIAVAACSSVDHDGGTGGISKYTSNLQSTTHGEPLTRIASDERGDREAGRKTNADWKPRSAGVVANHLRLSLSGRGFKSLAEHQEPKQT